MAEGKQARSSVFIVAVAEYADATKNRQAMADAAKSFASLFDDSSHATIHPPLIGGPKSDEILASLRAWGGDRSASTGLLLWTGHCELADAIDEPQLLGGGPGGDGVDASTLATQIANRRFARWVIVVDACYAYQVGAMVAEKLNRVVGRMSDARFAILSSADALSEAEAGVLTAALAAVLREGPDQRWWSRRQQLLSLDAVMARLEEYLEEHHPSYAHEPMQNTGGRRVGECFPNPLYVETTVAEALDEAHFLPKAKGVEAGESGWFFTGRVHALRRICSWLRRAGDPLFVVTGSAGTGKSAILGRVITLSVPAYRRQAEAAGILAQAPEGTVPDPGGVQLAFHARERQVNDLLRFLAEHLEAPMAREVTDLYAPIDARARARPYGLTIALDALDEAVGGHGRRMIDEIVVPIGRRPGVKFLIGTRPGVVDWAELPVPDDRLVNLDKEPDSLADLRAYARDRLLRLEDSPYRGDPDLAAAVAGGVAQVSASEQPGQAGVCSFLIARVITKTLASSPVVDVARPGWEAALPAGLEAAFEADLAAYGGRHGPAVERLLRDLLEALAWDEGQGIPRRLIPPVARAVTGRSFTDDDVTTLLRLAGGHVTEGQIDGWAVYRLYHEQLRAALRRVTLARETDRELRDADPDARATHVHARITDALLAAGRQADGWADADPYSQRILPRHAALGDRLDELVGEAGYLEAADPDALLAVLPLSGSGPAGSLIRSYRRAAHALAALRPAERALGLDIAEIAGAEPRPTHRGPSRVRWRRGPDAMELQTLAGHTNRVEAVALGAIDDTPVIVTGSNDRTVRVWDARTGRPRGQPLTGHTNRVTAVALGAIDDTPVIVT
ncbi:MAG: hypothetical protein ACRDYA_23010, partial [Egibacteraceae bacterium]